MQYEQQNQCCGFDVIEEGTKGCKFKKPCGKPLVLALKNLFKMATAVVGVGLIFHVLGAIAVGCFKGKMQKQQAAYDKNISLVEQSRTKPSIDQKRKERKARKSGR